MGHFDILFTGTTFYISVADTPSSTAGDSAAAVTVAADPAYIERGAAELARFC